MSDLVYTPPGVYIAEESQPVPNVPGLVTVPAARVALIGPAIGYQTYTEPVILTGTSPVTLTKLGIDADTIAVTAISGVLGQSGEAYIETSDWVATQAGTPDEEAVTTVARTSDGSITDGETVYVSYQYTDSAFYEPFTSSDWDVIQSRFGVAVTPATGAVNCPLSLAAKIVLEQGVLDVVCVPTKGSTPTSVTADQLATAMGKLEARSDIGVVCPLPVGITGSDGSPGDTDGTVEALLLHVVAMATAGQARIGVVGFEAAVTRSSTALAALAASSRVAISYPNVVTWYNGYSNSTVELGGLYLAAANAGMLGSLSPQTPLTRKTVRSFSGIPSRVFSTMTYSAKNALTAGGVLVNEQTADGRLVVRHGVSTDPTNVLTRELSITRGKDAKMSLVYRALDTSGLIGTEMNVNTPLRVRSVIEGALQQAVSAKIIINYTNLAVRVAVNDPTAIEVKYAYTPAYPLNKVNVAFSVNTVTGNISEV